MCRVDNNIRAHENYLQSEVQPAGQLRRAPHKVPVDQLRPADGGHLQAFTDQDQRAAEPCDFADDAAVIPALINRQEHRASVGLHEVRAGDP